MKRLKFILLSFLLYASSFGQPYQSCLEGEIVRWSIIDHPACDGPIRSTELIAYGDTLLNGIMYKKMFIDNSFDPYQAEETNLNWKKYNPQISYEWENKFIRESENASKLYIYDSKYDEEFLISDLDLEEESTFMYYTNFGIREAFVDSIYYYYGLKHIALHYYGYGQYDIRLQTFIESVGPEKWLIFPDGCNPHIGLNCFINNSIFYKNNRYVDFFNFNDLNCGCMLSWGDIKHETGCNFYVFIQEDIIEIVFDDETNIDITIYDIQGKIIYSKNKIHNKKLIVPATSFNSGVYFLKIINNENNKTILQKFIYNN